MVVAHAGIDKRQQLSHLLNLHSTVLTHLEEYASINKLMSCLVDADGIMIMVVVAVVVMVVVMVAYIALAEVLHSVAADFCCLLHLLLSNPQLSFRHLGLVYMPTQSHPNCQTDC